MNTPGVLFLSHQGLSFLDDLLTAAHRIGMESYVLSSQPTSSNSHRRRVLEERAAHTRFTDDCSLNPSDVLNYVQDLQKEGRNIRAVLSVWEGYRVMAALANRKLGAADDHPILLARLTDKLQLRSLLRRAGLSRARCEILTPVLFEKYRKAGLRKFIKPRTGLGSFGAHSLANASWAALEKIQKEMSTDYEYKSLFNKRGDFIVEDLIEGTEVSFETLLVDGTAHYLAVHEKVEVESTGGTVLENACASPPISLKKDIVEEGKRYVQQCLNAMKLSMGCFHIEAKYTGERWEIIEMNPRIGGALIKESVNALSGGVDLLETWIRLLVTRDHSQRLDLVDSVYERQHSPNRAKASFFRVYFGTPGKKIRNVSSNIVSPAPSVVRVHASAGTELPESSREIFLGQALWTWKTSPGVRSLKDLSMLSRNMLEVTYETRN